MPNGLNVPWNACSMAFWDSTYWEFMILDPNSLVAPIPKFEIVTLFWDFVYHGGLKFSVPKITCLLYFSDPEIPKCQDSIPKTLLISQLRGFQCKGPDPLSSKFLVCRTPKYQNFTLSNPFRDLGFRVTKDFGLHSELTDPEITK
jgi:hypothetical protein